MLFKDLIKIYKVYYVHITEILERFPTLNFDQGQKAFVMYQNFVNLTDAIKTKANKLIYTFNFPIQLPDFYNPEKGLIDTLKVVVNCADEDQEHAQKKDAVAKKLRGGMNRDQFKDKKNDDQAADAYFDCKIMETFNQSENEVPEEKFEWVRQSDLVEARREESKGGSDDLFAMINKSDFSTVGGRNNTVQIKKPAPKPQEVSSSNNMFDFDNFNGSSGA